MLLSLYVSSVSKRKPWLFLQYIVSRHFKFCAQLFSVTNCPIELKPGTITDDINILKLKQINLEKNRYHGSDAIFCILDENAIIYQIMANFQRYEELVKISLCIIQDIHC